MTFEALSKQADFSGAKPASLAPEEPEQGDSGAIPATAPTQDALQLNGLVYNIQLHLPDSRDPAVYDALFKSLRAHLVR